MPVDEDGVSEAIAKAILLRYPGSWVFHPVGTPWHRQGIPDLLLCIQGRFVGIEVKHQKPGESHAHALGRATTRQLAEIEAIKLAGGSAGVATNIAEALEIVEKAFMR